MVGEECSVLPGFCGDPRAEKFVLLEEGVGYPNVDHTKMLDKYFHTKKIIEKDRTFSLFVTFLKLTSHVSKGPNVCSSGTALPVAK